MTTAVRAGAVDRCPGALSLHEAADGPLARIRLPGGRIRGDQLAALAALAADGTLELTSRANLQIRGVRDPAGIAAAVADLGLLPSPTHELVRNIVAAPDADYDAAILALDRALCARGDLAALPGRWLFAVGPDPDADVSIVPAARSEELGAVYAGGQVRRTTDPLGAALDVAARFLQVRGTAWRLRELPDPAAVLDGEPAAPPAALPLPDGLQVPLGRLTGAMVAALVADEPHDLLVFTRDRTVITRRPRTESSLAIAGLIVDPQSPWKGVTACAGAPRCASAHADTEALAQTYISTHPDHGRVHITGCARRCGTPSTPHVAVIADL